MGWTRIDGVVVVVVVVLKVGGGKAAEIRD
jgi:hypothetical protein